MNDSCNAASAKPGPSDSAPLTVESVTDRHGVRPLTARSAVASTLLGVDPPRLPAAHLVEAGRLFGIAEGTVRVALSRMVASGELEADGGAYRLAGHLLDRHARQDQSRAPLLKPWEGVWALAVVRSGRRDAQSRADLRSAARALRLAELREGVWTRPDNLDDDRLPEAVAVLATQCDLFAAEPGGEPASLSRRLWDLPAWARQADALVSDTERATMRLEADDTDSLAPAFLLGAGVLRHLLGDPLLPDPYLPADWPGTELRGAYERYLIAYRAVWRQVFAR